LLFLDPIGISAPPADFSHPSASPIFSLFQADPR
jgi:hypothetical protein